MGGYTYELPLRAKKPAEKVVNAAGLALWQWFRGELAGRAAAGLGARLLEYVDMYTPSAVGPHDHAEWPTVRFEQGALCIHLGDAGGVAHNSCLAAVHALTLIAERDPDAVDRVLAGHGLSRAATQPVDAMIHASRFFLFQGSVGMTDAELVSRDANDDDDGGEWPIDTLPAAERTQVRAFIARGVCECPACSTPARRTRRAASTPAKRPAKRRRR